MLGVLLCGEELAALCEMDSGNLDTTAPIGHSELEGGGIGGGGGVWTRVDEEVGGRGGDVGEFPIETSYSTLRQHLSRSPLTHYDSKGTHL